MNFLVKNSIAMIGLSEKNGVRLVNQGAPVSYSRT